MTPLRLSRRNVTLRATQSGDDRARGAVHRHRLAGAQAGGGVGHADDRGDAVLPRDDRAVRVGPAHLHDEAARGEEQRGPAGVGRGSDEDLAGLEVGVRRVEHHPHDAGDGPRRRRACRPTRRRAAGAARAPPARCRRRAARAGCGGGAARGRTRRGGRRRRAALVESPRSAASTSRSSRKKTSDGGGEQAAPRQLGADDRELGAGVREQPHEVVLVRLAHARELAGAAQREAGDRRAHPGAPPDPGDDLGDRRLGRGGAAGEPDVGVVGRVGQAQVVGQRAEHLGRVVGPARHPEVDLRRRPVPVLGEERRQLALQHRRKRARVVAVGQLGGRRPQRLGRRGVQPRRRPPTARGPCPW